MGDQQKRGAAARKAGKIGLGSGGYTLVVCMDRKTAKCCKAKSMRATWEAIRRRCKQWQADGDPPVVRIKAACIGVCRSGPIVGVFPDGVWYGDCQPDVIDRIFDEHLQGGRVVQEHVIAAD